MSPSLLSVAFQQTDLPGRLDHLSDAELDELDFGVIAFDHAGVVLAYNRRESILSGFDPARVIGRRLFETVAPCINRFVSRNCGP